MTAQYDPQDYWESRLVADASLRATGHWMYSRRYNDWLYRAKRRALRHALRGQAIPFTALDVGSGAGWVVAELQSAGAEVTGCDIAPTAVSRLRERFPDAEFSLLEIGSQDFPWGNNSFDVVTMLDVAYHMTGDEHWRSAISEISRVLRPGGRFIVSDAFGSLRRRPAPHVCFRTASDWKGAAGQTGLVLERLLPYFRWLSRDPGPRRALPDGVRGALEYALDRLTWRAPHMYCGVFIRR